MGNHVRDGWHNKDAFSERFIHTCLVTELLGTQQFLRRYLTLQMIPSAEGGKFNDMFAIDCPRDASPEGNHLDFNIGTGGIDLHHPCWFFDATGSPYRSSYNRFVHAKGNPSAPLFCETNCYCRCSVFPSHPQQTSPTSFLLLLNEHESSVVCPLKHPPCLSIIVSMCM